MKTLMALSFILLTSSALGAAYVPAKGKGIAIVGVNSYSAKEEFNRSRDTKSFGENGRFTKRELYYYLAYSLRNDFALVASGALYNELTYKNDFDKTEFNGSGDHFVSGRYFLTKDSSGAKALQLGVGLPAYSKHANPAPGNRQEDLELRYLQDYFQLGGLAFLSWEAAYRFRNSSPADQLRADVNVGMNLWKLLVMGHVNYIQGLRNSSGRSSSINPNTATDFDLLKMGVSAAWRFRPTTSVQLGFMKDIWGRATGKGQGVFVSVWKDF